MISLVIVCPSVHLVPCIQAGMSRSTGPLIPWPFSFCLGMRLHNYTLDTGQVLYTVHELCRARTVCAAEQTEERLGK